MRLLFCVNAPLDCRGRCPRRPVQIFRRMVGIFLQKHICVSIKPFIEVVKDVKEQFDKGCERTGITPKWDGEIYFEWHRGTYTSISLMENGIKRGLGNAGCDVLKAENIDESAIKGVLVLGDRLQEVKNAYFIYQQ